jgi:hypothetical protein
MDSTFIRQVFINWIFFIVVLLYNLRHRVYTRIVGAQE